MRSRLMRGFAVLGVSVVALSGMTVLTADAAPGAVIDSVDCVQNELPRNDDFYTDRVLLPFGVNFFGNTFESLYVNNNGNVTFDSPLGTYTPFGLANTYRQIIAPFFADVDTRAGNTVHYGWGNTTYEGHRAFCVNWIGVGYYNQHTDKLNSFQLLLVQREDAGVGDFDIVFNYDSIQWETGDASGGSGGLGGVSAVAGFSNGNAYAYELPGSMVNGAFLDSNQRGLANTSRDSSVTGRHIFRVRAGGAPLTDYVALGDSYQSGEGAGDYLLTSDSLTNQCHRSVHAYPYQLVDRGLVDVPRDFFKFGACSGALIEHLHLPPFPDHTVYPNNPPYDDGIAQLDRLGPSTKLVTIGIGGNNLGFSTILQDCIASTTIRPINPFGSISCQHDFSEDIDTSFSQVFADGLLRQVYEQVRRRAPFARIVVVTYPRFYVTDGSNNSIFDEYCHGVRKTDQQWINTTIRKVDEAILNEASSLGLQVVNIYDAPTVDNEDHGLCSHTGQNFMNGVRLPRWMESYHPNAYGHTIIANWVAAALNSPPPGTLFNVLPGQTITQQLAIRPGPELSVSTQWPGSDIVLSLTSPSGHTYTRDSTEPSLWHTAGPTFETYTITNPEPGTWTATLYGAQVAPLGEQARLVVHNPPVPNTPPTAAFTQTFTDRTVTADASTSTDPDGTVVDYVWDFGDGTTATGATVSHTYTTPGTYLTTLAITDNQDDQAFATATSTVTIPAYTFTGFGAPVSNTPTLNTMQAGRAVPLKFSLGGDHGLNILAPGSPNSIDITCDTQAETHEVELTDTPGNSTLTYDPTTDQYQYIWKTEPTWAGTCRKLTLTLDDGSIHQALFHFRN